MTKHETFMRLIKKSILGMCMACAVIGTVSAAEVELPNWKEANLTGDWGGARAELYRKGIDIGLTHKSDLMANTSGGLKRGAAWLGHTEARLTLDLDKLWGLNNTTAYVHYHSDLGSKFNSNYVGSFMGVDNIEVATNTAQFYQAWLQKNFLDDHVSTLAGLYAIDSEFYVTETSGLFLQPPYGMANDLAQAGVNGPPIFPMGALAVRVKLVSPDENFYAQAALTDGVPGDPNNPNGTHIKLGNGDGTLSIIELGYTPHLKNTELNKDQEPAEIFNKTAIGFWRYTPQFDAIDGSGLRHNNQGAYVLAERTLFTESAHPSQGLAGFFRFGVASDEVNVADWTGSAGLRYHGLINGRDDDVAGIAITVNHAGDSYRQANSSERQEIDVEATYRAQVTSYFAVQPTLQFIDKPNFDSTIKNAWILGSRFEFEL
jgi:porin